MCEQSVPNGGRGHRETAQSIIWLLKEEQFLVKMATIEVQPS